MADQDAPRTPDHEPADSDERVVPLDDPALPAVPLADEDEPPVGDAVPAPDGGLPPGTG
ncbi:MAG: hypothetical protein JWM31_1014 [Solirubrobacterales bacterium]|nr:hypothetical protein [Solirubrobacterales bacterium]